MAMGSPLGPTFANIFLCHHEQKWIDDRPSAFKPVLYKRYVDDTFVIFKETSHADQFLHYLNSKHNNIKFTMESEIDSQIPFLDLNIKKINNGLSTSVYRKSTFSGLGTSFFSYCSFSFKINSIRTLLHRAFTLSSSYLDFHNEVIYLKDFFYKNGFTTNLFEKTLNKFLQVNTAPNN